MLHYLNTLFPVRYSVFALLVMACMLSVFTLVAFDVGLFWLLACGALVALGVADLTQTKRSLLRN